ncbi:hypothetical protein [Kaistia terrae]|uniref:hypothetical protein n=1 Tax=Kaistia terrae TaxID=537017 RepID=UPI002255E0D3|nr:hypothetical protein [Kaistia terrae]MCX5576911.1 hypothetical protein [Kaistia terrae]
MPTVFIDEVVAKYRNLPVDLVFDRDFLAADAVPSDAPYVRDFIHDAFIHEQAGVLEEPVEIWLTLCREVGGEVLFRILEHTFEWHFSLVDIPVGRPHKQVKHEIPPARAALMEVKARRDVKHVGG